MIWPLTGGTGTGSGTPASPGVQAPAASTTRGAGSTSPPARRTPVTRSSAATSPVTRAPRRISPPARSTATARAATSLRGSAEWSPGTSSARRTVGASAGSARRAWLGRSRSTGRPADRRNASSRSSTAASSASRATISVPVARKPGSSPLASASSAQNVSKLSAARMPSAVSAPSPKSDSATGASMPAATCHAPGSPASSTHGRRPRRAASHAHAMPIAPPPTTATSEDSDGPELRMLPPYAGTTRIRFDGRRPGAALSARSAGSRSQTIVSPPARLDPMDRRARLQSARLYLVCDARPESFLRAALRGGVDIVQLRDKALGDDELIEAARVFRAAADELGALFVLNDRPDLVAACAADGVHVGQDDATPAAARAAVGPELIVGRSTHAPGQAGAAVRDPDVDYLAVGPVHPTPTKPGRQA